MFFFYRDMSSDGMAQNDALNPTITMHCSWSKEKTSERQFKEAVGGFW